jgi:hypothetical protein
MGSYARVTAWPIHAPGNHGLAPLVCSGPLHFALATTEFMRPQSMADTILQRESDGKLHWCCTVLATDRIESLFRFR